MNGERAVDTRLLWRVLPVPAALWAVVFGWKPVAFWYDMIPAMAILLALAWALRGKAFSAERLTLGDVAAGVGSAAALYGVFWVGNAVAPLVLPGAHADVGSVYGLKAGFSPWFVGTALVLLFGPAESLFWQGLVQPIWMRRFGKTPGWLLTAGFYAAIHAFSGNPMLVLAALVAGLFWGGQYRWQGRLWPIVISHSLWDLSVLVLWPIR